MTITLKHEATCADCGAVLPAGSKARWFRDGSVYGNACHRWQIHITPEQAEEMRRLLADVIESARRKRISDAMRDRLLTLASTWGKQVTNDNFAALMRELKQIRSSLRQEKILLLPKKGIS